MDVVDTVGFGSLSYGATFKYQDNACLKIFPIVRPSPDPPITAIILSSSGGLSLGSEQVEPVNYVAQATA